MFSLYLFCFLLVLPTCSIPCVTTCLNVLNHMWHLLKVIIIAFTMTTIVIIIKVNITIVIIIRSIVTGGILGRHEREFLGGRVAALL